MAKTLPPGLSPLDIDRNEFEYEPPDESQLPIDDQIDKAFIESLDICDVHHEPRCFCACNHPDASNH